MYMHHTIAEQQILDYIDSLDIDNLLYYSKCYVVKDFKHYMNLQFLWIKDEKYYTGIELSKCPTDIEVLNNWSLHKNSERFKAFYVLYYPDKVEKLETDYQI